LAAAAAKTGRDNNEAATSVAAFLLVECMALSTDLPPSLREAKRRGNPESHTSSLDCFVVKWLLAMTGREQRIVK